MAEGNHIDRAIVRWTPEEDRELDKWVKIYDESNWAAISTHIPGRTGKSCRLRWRNQLSPGVVKRPFSDEEDKIILDCHSRVGSKWAFIATKLTGRTDNQVKNHFNSTLRRHLKLKAANVAHNGLDSDSSESETNPPPPKRTHLSSININEEYKPVVETDPIPFPDRVGFNKFYYPGPPLLPAEQEAETHFGLPLSLTGDVGGSSGSGSGSAPPPQQICTGSKPVEMLGIDPYLLRMMESPIQADPLPQSPPPPPPPPPVLGMRGGGDGNPDNNGFRRMLLQDEVLMEQQLHRDGPAGCGGWACTAEEITNTILRRMEARAMR